MNLTITPNFLRITVLFSCTVNFMVNLCCFPKTMSKRKDQLDIYAAVVSYIPTIESRSKNPNYLL